MTRKTTIDDGGGDAMAKNGRVGHVCSRRTMFVVTRQRDMNSSAKKQMLPEDEEGDVNVDIVESPSKQGIGILVMCGPVLARLFGLGLGFRGPGLRQISSQALGSKVGLAWLKRS